MQDPISNSHIHADEVDGERVDDQENTKLHNAGNPKGVGDSLSIHGIAAENAHHSMDKISSKAARNNN